MVQKQQINILYNLSQPKFVDSSFSFLFSVLEKKLTPYAIQILQFDSRFAFVALVFDMLSIFLIF